MTAPLPRTLQDLPPRWAHFCLGLERFAAEDLGLDLGRARLVVGLSGGLDSTALLLACRCLTVRSGGAVLAGHLDHGLRPESAGDARAAAELCTALGVPCESRRVDVGRQAAANGQGLEEAGRELRYALLEDLRSKSGADWIVLGHHLDDLAEDVLLRLVRGTGWPGLSGMPARDDGRRLLRPLLLTPKAELRAFLEGLGLSWREDASNREPLFRRNRLRHAVLPLLLEENPGFLESVARLWRMGRLDASYWSAQMDQLPGVLHGPDGPFLDGGFLEQAHPALRLRLYKQALDSLGPGQVLADSLLAMDAARCEGRFGAVFQFPGDKLVRVERSGLSFSLKLHHGSR